MADFEVRQGDTLPGVMSILLDETGSPVALPTGSSCSMLLCDTNGTVVLTGVATIADQTANPGMVSYAWQPADTASPMVGSLTWRVTLPSGNQQTFPTVGAESVRILPAWIPDPPVSLAEFKTHLGISRSVDDAETQGFLDAAVTVVESAGIAGPCSPRTVTDTFQSPGGTVVLRTWPVMSVTSVTQTDPSGSSVPISAGYGPNTYQVDPATGVVKANYGWWFGRCGQLTVVYVAGRSQISPGVRTAILEAGKYLWRQVKGGSQVIQEGQVPLSPAALSGMASSMTERLRLLCGDDAAPPGVG